MAEYIPREAAMEQCNRHSDYTAWSILNGIEAIPAADVEPVRHGRWVQLPLNGTRIWRCSKCETIGSPQWNYCPKCGSRMDEEAQHER